MHRLPYLFIILIFLSCNSDHQDYSGWESYGGDKTQLHYSSLTNIDTSNVMQLQPAWMFHTGDADPEKFSQIQCNPIIIDSIIYFTSPQLRLFAVHAGNGQQIWSFDPDSLYRNNKSYQFILNNNRGITYWTDGKKDKRLYYVAGSMLHCLDAQTGKLVKSFGNDGTVDLHEGLGKEVKDLFITATSPGIIFKDLYILGSRVDEGAAAAPGHIRAFDTRTGKQQWIFHTIPQPGEFGYDTWEDSSAYRQLGGANSWGGFSLDEQRGLLFAPTGSVSADFYGGKRKGQNLFGNCLLAIDAATGKRKWHFQFVHHDVWDYDLPSAPALVTIKKDGQSIDAVLQTTKHGMVWLFERETGKPIYPINEVAVDTATELTNEKLWPTQPIPTFTDPFVRQTFTADDLNPYLPDSSRQKLKRDLENYRFGKMFIPPGKKTSVVLPGFDGGAEWGGPTIDPEKGILYVNANEMAWLLTIRDNPSEIQSKETFITAGKRLYQQYCLSCHGENLQGSGNYPALLNLAPKYSHTALIELMNTGRRMMPAFAHLTNDEKEAILSYVQNDKAVGKNTFIASSKPADEYRHLPYGITGYYKFLSPEGMPAIAPPWGTLTAIDLSSGKHLWKKNLGEYASYKAFGVPPTGTENYGGSVVTKGGILFIAATSDSKLRAFNSRTGELLWEYELPAPGFATPTIYQYNNKQYLVIACGGGKLKTRSADVYIAFALP